MQTAEACITVPIIGSIGKIQGIYIRVKSKESIIHTGLGKIQGQNPRSLSISQVFR